MRDLVFSVSIKDISGCGEGAGRPAAQNYNKHGKAGEEINTKKIMEINEENAFL